MPSQGEAVVGAAVGKPVGAAVGAAVGRNPSVMDAKGICNASPLASIVGRCQNLARKFCKLLAGSFSAVSKRNFARKYAFDSIF